MHALISLRDRQRGLRIERQGDNEREAEGEEERDCAVCLCVSVCVCVCVCVRVPVWSERASRTLLTCRRTLQSPLRQYLYVCTSKSSKLSTVKRLVSAINTSNALLCVFSRVAPDDNQCMYDVVWYV
jgi:hypothetical protein